MTNRQYGNLPEIIKIFSASKEKEYSVKKKNYHSVFL